MIKWRYMKTQLSGSSGCGFQQTIIISVPNITFIYLPIIFLRNDKTATVATGLILAALIMDCPLINSLLRVCLKTVHNATDYSLSAGFDASQILLQLGNSLPQTIVFFLITFCFEFLWNFYFAWAERTSEESKVFIYQNNVNINLAW